METVSYFFRHPDPIFFSVEKLFSALGEEIARSRPAEFRIQRRYMPFPSNWKRVWANIRYARRSQTKINHITGDIHYAILGLSRRNVNVLTIHDCVMLKRLSRRHPKFWLLKWLWYDLPVRKADAVVAISENTRRELIHFTGCPESKIRVIGNFVDPGFQPDTDVQPGPGSYNSQKPHVLFIGTTPNKNLYRLVAALQGLDVRLEIVGKLNEEAERLLTENQIDYVSVSGLTTEQLLAKYTRCDILAFPSTYEGFGLPIIEAQAIGRPVLTSNLPPMNEVSGGAAALIDPYDVSSIRKGLLDLLNDAVYRRHVVEKGFVNVKRFRLEHVAGQYAQLYHELYNSKLNGRGQDLPEIA